MWARTAGKSKQGSRVPTATDSGHRCKRAQVSQRSSVNAAGASGLVEVAPAGNAKRKPLKCFTPLLRERMARVAEQARWDAQSDRIAGLGALCLQALPRRLRWSAPPSGPGSAHGAAGHRDVRGGWLGPVATALAGLSAHVYTPFSKLSKEGRRRCWVEMCEAAKRQPFPPAPFVVTFCAGVLQAAGYRLARLYLAVVVCCVHRYTLSRALFQRSCSQTRFQAHSDALRTLQHFFYGARSDCKVIPSKSPDG